MADARSKAGVTLKHNRGEANVAAVPLGAA